MFPRTGEGSDHEGGLRFGVFFFGERECDGEDRAVYRVAFGGQTAVHGFHRVFRDGETEPVSARAACAVEAVEPLEDMRQRLGGNQRLSVAYAKEGAPVLCRKGNAHFAACRLVFQRVVDQRGDRRG